MIMHTQHLTSEEKLAYQGMQLEKEINGQRVISILRWVMSIYELNLSGHILSNLVYPSVDYSEKVFASVALNIISVSIEYLLKIRKFLSLGQISTFKSWRKSNTCNTMQLTQNRYIMSVLYITT